MTIRHDLSLGFKLCSLGCRVLRAEVPSTQSNSRQSGGPERPSSHVYATHICDAICDHEKFFVTRSRPQRPISSSAGFCNANNFPNARAASFTVGPIRMALVRLTQHRC